MMKLACWPHMMILGGADAFGPDQAIDWGGQKKSRPPVDSDHDLLLLLLRLYMAMIGG